MTENYTVYTDATGRVLKVGQTVVYCEAGTSNIMLVAKVVKLYPKTVELDEERDSWQKPRRRAHSSVAVVREPDES